MSTAYSVGIIGAGAILDFHLEGLLDHPELRVTAVAETNAALLASRARALGCRAFGDYRELLAEAPDLVLVLLPHALHYPVAIDALRAGCHVVVEKPMALDAAQCAAMLAEASSRGRMLAVSDSASSIPGALRTGARYRAGALGAFLAGSIINVRAYFDGSRPAWFLDPAASGGGMFANLGVHRLALARACLPDLRPISVYATVGRLAARPVEACTAALVRYSGGGGMHYEETGYFPRPAWLAAGIHFVFEQGIVAWDDNTWRLQTAIGVTEEPLEPRPTQYAPLYREILAFLSGEGPEPSAAGNAQDVAVAQAAYQSAREEKEILLDDPPPRISPARNARPLPPAAREHPA